MYTPGSALRNIDVAAIERKAGGANEYQIIGAFKGTRASYKRKTASSPLR